MVAPISQILQLPLVLIAPIVIFIFNPIAGSSAVGTLQSHGTVSDLDAILAIIVGSLLLLPFYGFRSFKTSSRIKILPAAATAEEASRP